MNDRACSPRAATSEGAKFSDRQPRQSDLSSGFRREMRAASPVRRRNDYFLCLESRPRPTTPEFLSATVPQLATVSTFLAPSARAIYRVVIYLERADEWWPLDTERTAPPIRCMQPFPRRYNMHVYIYTHDPGDGLSRSCNIRLLRVIHRVFVVSVTPRRTLLFLRPLLARDRANVFPCDFW